MVYDDPPFDNDERCACGRPLHYTHFKTRVLVDRLIAEHGPSVLVRTSAGSFLVPRHYIALHGLRSRDVPILAQRYGWPSVSGKERTWTSPSMKV